MPNNAPTGDLERNIRVAVLEQLYEYHWREATASWRCVLFAGDHYTYRDLVRAHQIAADWVAREHMGILKYVESEKRLRVIQDRIRSEHEALIAEERIAK